MFSMISGEDLRRMRLSVNRTTVEMANKVGVSRITYEKWENGIGQPKMNQCLELFIYCRLDVTPLFKQLAELKNQFSHYKDQDDDKPNALRSSQKKNHLKESLPEHEQEQHDENT